MDVIPSRVPEHCIKKLIKRSYLAKWFIEHRRIDEKYELLHILPTNILEF
jgi:hypothetical protein